MRISCVICDLSGNSIVRTYPIAKVLERNHDVEVIGFSFAGGIYPPYANEFDFRYVQGCRFPRVLSEGLRLCRLITGDVVFAFKPKLTSYGTALLHKLKSRTPIILDIEDWELAPFYDAGGGRPAVKSIASGWLHPHAFKYSYLAEKLIPLADQVTVVSGFLQRRYGGVKLPHGADTDFFMPGIHPAADLKRSYGLEGKTVILFPGLPRVHKGVADIVVALKRLGDPSLVLVVVGGEPDNPLARSLVQHGSGYVQHVPQRPHREMPAVWEMGDVVVIPQRSSHVAEAQVPGKIFEAMAMAKPIVATAVSDIPEILGPDCGVVLRPSDVDALVMTLQQFRHTPEIFRQMGARARERCVERFSWNAMERILESVLASLS